MEIILSAQTNKPIYEQIYDQIKRQILAGTLKTGEELPSMRILAKDLKISVITTKKAYEELIRDGFVTSIKAKGCYVAQIDAVFRKTQEEQNIRIKLQQIVSQGRSIGMEKKDFKEFIDKVFEE